MLSAEEIVKLFDFIGSLFCHQSPDRTLWIGGHYLPVCARDTGVFIGLLSGYLLLIFLRNREAGGPPDLYVSSAMTLPLWADSFGQLFGFWTSTNDLRLITGLLFGTALAPLLIYALSMSPLKGRVPIIGVLQPRITILDDKDSWFDVRALFIGIILSVILFIATRSIIGSGLSLPYWILGIIIIGGILWHFFVLPPMLLIAAFARLLARNKKP